MTESRDPGGGRLDLRALDAAADPGRTDAIVGAVLTSIASGSPRDDDIPRLLRAQRRMLAVAAVLAALATAAVVSAPRRSEVGASDVIASWAESSHVPTNGELLAAYQGYRP
jgi:hypothetical protein